MGTLNIQFGKFTINKISDSSGVFSGDNLQTNFTSSTHKNEGSGTTTGDYNTVKHNKHLVAKKPDKQDES